MSQDKPTTPAKGGIYAIRNTLDGKLYIGSAVDIRRRWMEHRHRLARGTHHSKHLQNAWNRRGGAASFVFEVIEPVSDPADLIAREQYYIDRFQSAWRTRGYNICRQADSHLGRRRSSATRAKISAAGKGKKLTPEHCAKIGAIHAGKPKSREHRARISAAHKGRVFSPEWKARISAANAGKELTPETKAKMSAVRKGRKLSPENAARVAAANRDRNRSAEHRAKVVAANTGKRHTPEAIAKMSAAHKNRGPEHAARVAAYNHSPEAKAKLVRAREKRWAAHRAAKEAAAALAREQLRNRPPLASWGRPVDTTGEQLGFDFGEAL